MVDKEDDEKFKGLEIGQKSFSSVCFGLIYMRVLLAYTS
jgi:hypothetical protein